MCAIHLETKKINGWWARKLDHGIDTLRSYHRSPFVLAHMASRTAKGRLRSLPPCARWTALIPSMHRDTLATANALLRCLSFLLDFLGTTKKALHCVLCPQHHSLQCQLLSPSRLEGSSTRSFVLQAVAIGTEDVVMALDRAARRNQRGEGTKGLGLFAGS
jgi:hypothetical protein